MAYAYAVLNQGGPGIAKWQFVLQRVNSAGANDNILINSLTPAPGFQPFISADMITNADTGIVISWDELDLPMLAGNVPMTDSRAGRAAPRDAGSSSMTYGMAITNGTSVNLLSAAQVGGQSGHVAPVLQAQDGSFFGQVAVSGQNNPSLVAFDQTGGVRWTVPNDQPQIATADGGVVSKSGITYDQNGNATGQIAMTYQYTWTGSWYGISAASILQATAFVPIDVAGTFWALAQGNASHSGAANKPVTKDVQQLIAQIARSYVGSRNWLDTPGSNKCNLFVHDVLKQAGLNPPISPRNPSWGYRVKYLLGLVDSPGYPALAGDWANPNTGLKCWRPITINPAPLGFVGPPLPSGALPPDISIPGDVIAEAIQYSDATGHVGIIVGTQQTASADSAAPCFPPNNPAGTIDISDYGFRADTWVDPFKNSAGLPCRTHGLESKAVVKRFVCQ